MTTKPPRADDAPVREFRLRVRIRMDEAEEAELRAHFRLGAGESTRRRLAALVESELGGLGVSGPWWHEVLVD